MCLTWVDEQTRKGRGIGYKYFASDESCHLRFPFFGGRIKYNQWCQDKAKGDITVDPEVSYPKGYHIFLSKEGAVWCGGVHKGVRKVEYRSVVASGTQCGFPVVIARELYIHKAANSK